MVKNNKGINLDIAGVVQMDSYGKNTDLAGIVIDSTELGLWDLNLSGREIHFNAGYTTRLGYTSEELTSLADWEEHIHSQDIVNVRKVFSSHLQGQIPFYECTYRFQKKEGDWVWILARGKVTRWADDGQPLQLVGVNHDITLQKMADDFRMDLQFRDLAEAMPIGIAIYLNDELRYLNITAQNIINRLPADIPLLSDLFDTILPESRPQFRNALHLFKDNLEPPPLIEIEITVSKDVLRSLEIRFGSVVFDGQQATLITIFDITNRKQSEKLQQAVYHISKAANSAQGLDELYSVIHSIISTLLPAANFSIALCKEESNTLTFVYRTGDDRSLPAEIEFSNQKPYYGLANYLLRKGKPLLVTRDQYNDLIESGEILKMGTSPLEWLGTPLKTAEGKVIGLISVQTFDEGICYEDQHKDILAFVSSQVAMAIERKQAEEMLIYQAMYDQLTGLPNRILLEDRLREAAIQSRRTNSLVGVAVFDIDRFKDINDTLGHHVGDGILKQLSQRLKNNLRESDTVARLGGDDFVIVMNNLQKATDALIVISKIMDVIKTPFEASGNEFYLDANIGYAIYPDDGDDPTTLLKNADNALDFARTNLQDNVMRYEPSMQAIALERLHIVNRLRHSIEAGRFVMHYQPQVDLVNGEVIGLEALIRWVDPDLGLISPNEFISLAEESGLIHPLGDWVLEEVCRQSHAWEYDGFPSMKIAVNVSSIQFAKGDLLERIAEKTLHTGANGHHLAIEITESVFMSNVEEVAERLSRLREAGIRVDLDDFGTMYSSLAYLRTLPLDTLKIDKTFTQDLGVVHKNQFDPSALVSAIITLGHGLNLKVMAEGVETEKQLHILRSLGCDQAQGYLFSYPVPSHEVKQNIQLARQKCIDMFPC